MPEARQAMVPVQIDYVCDRCGQGRMRPTGMTLTSNPPQYPHACTACDARGTFLVIYPTVRFEPDPAKPWETP